MVPPHAEKDTDTLADTGVCVKLPEGMAGQVLPRSSLFTYHRLEMVIGLLDSDFSGEKSYYLNQHFTFN